MARPGARNLLGMVGRHGVQRHRHLGHLRRSLRRQDRDSARRLPLLPGETRYLFFSKEKGLEVKFGNHGLKVGVNGVQKLVSGTWKDINS